jgi:L-erythrulose 1-phosphate isomerase
MTTAASPRLLIGSSVKMHLTAGEVRTWLEGCRTAFAGASGIAGVADAEGTDGVDVFLLPPFVCLPMAAELLSDTGIAYGTQNMHWEDRGAYTGEISPVMLVEFGATFVEIGHAERRRHFGETDATVNLKVRAALRHGLRPILCIGEGEWDVAAADAVLREQLLRALDAVAEAELEGVVVAYEPVWAIGQAAAAEPAYVHDRHLAIREQLINAYGEAGGQPRLIYGGSVSPANARQLAAHPEVQGLFVGRAALQPASFLRIAEEAAAAR